MNCKQGDLAIIIGPHLPGGNVLIGHCVCCVNLLGTGASLGNGPHAFNPKLGPIWQVDKSLPIWQLEIGGNSGPLQAFNACPDRYLQPITPPADMTEEEEDLELLRSI